jgi:hypothetical protein
LRIQLEPHCRAEQRARVAAAQAVHLQLGKVLELLDRLACREHDPDRLRQQAAGDKGERQRRRLVEPLRVIDHAQQRTFVGHLREQAQHRQPDEEPIRGGAVAQPEHDLERLTLRRRKRREPIEHRPAQLMQTPERQLHLRLHPHRPMDRQA